MMADEEVVEVTEVELKEAREIGWADKDKWRGKPEDWVDAKTFLERGRQILPIVTAHNRKLKTDLENVGGELASVKEALRASTAAIEALQQSHDEDVQEQVEAARKQLKEELEAASRDGDHKAVADLTEQMTRLNTAATTADDKDGKGGKDGKGENADTTETALHPEVKQWFLDHSDFAKDGRRIALARAIADEKRTGGDKRIGTAFMDDVAEEVERVLGGAGAREGVDRVASGNGGTSRQQLNNGGGKSYSDLPKEAKDACDKMATRLVGENRAHKTIESWRKSYVTQYYKD